MTFDIALTALSVLFIFGITPGPATMRVATISANNGLGLGLVFSVGVGIGYGLVVLSCAALLDTLRNAGPGVALFQKVLGIALIGWTSFKILTARPCVSGPLSLGAARGTVQRAVMFQFINPKAWIAGFLVLESLGRTHEVASLLWWQLPVLTCAAILLCVAVWAIAGASIRPLLCNTLRFRAFHTVMGLGLLATTMPMVSA